MNRTRCYVLLLTVALAAALFGTLWYFHHSAGTPKVPDGTLVQSVSREECA